MQNSSANGVSSAFVVTHPLDPDDGKITEAMRAEASSTKCGGGGSKHEGLSTP